MNATKLILIKHSKPLVRADVPAHEWKLSDEGRRACAPLADEIASHSPALIITSDEPKAIETGRLVAERLNVPLETHPDLHEHDRSNVPMLATREFISLMALFFKEPKRLVLGRETAWQAADRFNTAINAALESHTGKTLAIITHGTVLALFAAQHGGGDPFLLWRRMGLPSYAVFSGPDLNMLQVIERINTSS